MWLVVPLLVFQCMYAIGGALAAPAEVYGQAVALAAAGRDAEAVARLQGALDVYPGADAWCARMQAAVALLSMRHQGETNVSGLDERSAYASLTRAYLRTHPAPEAGSLLMPGALAVVFPGAGHAWLGRWHDAWVAAMLVWPMLLLTFWAWRRRMGPVTVFFAVITIWLWSGTVFSAVSLAERGSHEAYLAWWQGLWQASGLQGQPW